MSIRKFLENEIIAAGERVLGKMDSFPPVVFYLCKNGEGDLCTPWAINISAGGQTPGGVLAEKIMAELGDFFSRGSGPRRGYINMRFSDKFLLDSINGLAEEFEPSLFYRVVPDDSVDSLIKDYCVYRACRIDNYAPSQEYFTGELRELAVAVIGAEVTGNTELLEKLFETMCRKNLITPSLLRATARVFSAGGQTPGV